MPSRGLHVHAFVCVRVCAYTHIQLNIGRLMLSCCHIPTFKQEQQLKEWCVHLYDKVPAQGLHAHACLRRRVYTHVHNFTAEIRAINIHSNTNNNSKTSAHIYHKVPFQGLHVHSCVNVCVRAYTHVHNLTSDTRDIISNVISDTRDNSFQTLAISDTRDYFITDIRDNFII